MFLPLIADIVDPDEMAFHLGLHCLSKYAIRVTSIQMVKVDTED